MASVVVTMLMMAVVDDRYRWRSWIVVTNGDSDGDIMTTDSN